MYLTNYLLLLMCISCALCQTIVNSGNSNCVPNNGDCQYHSDCCSEACLSFVNKCVVRNSAKPRPPPGQSLSPITGLPINNTSLQELINSLFASTEKPPTPDQIGVGIVVNRFGEEDNIQSITEDVNTNPNCLAIGQKCFRHSECCSNRCHGFLHQCVT